MERHLDEYKRRFPKFYALVRKAVGPDSAPEVFVQCLEESAAMSRNDMERASYAYVALRRRVRGDK